MQVCVVHWRFSKNSTINGRYCHVQESVQVLLSSSRLNLFNDILFSVRSLYRLQITLLVSLSIAPLAHNNEDYIIGSDTWCPYTCEAGKDFNGYSVDLIAAALALSQSNSSYVNAPFSRVVANIESGYWHILPATDMSITPNLLITSEPVAETSYVFVTRTDSDWQYDSNTGLKDIRLGIVLGYGYGPQTTKYIETNPEQIVALSTKFPQRSLLLMLMAHRVDAILEDKRVVEYWAGQLGVQDELRIAGKERLLNLMVGIKHQPGAEALIEKIDQGLRILKSHPKLEELNTKYGFNE